MITKEYIAFSFLFDVVDPAEIEDWKQRQIDADQSCSVETYKLKAFDHSDTRAFFVDCLQPSGEDHWLAKDYELVLERLLQRTIARLLNGELEPLRFCEFFGSLEAYCVDNGPETAGQLYYPNFVGDLYNACDWCDESWTLDNSDQLREEATQVLRCLGKRGRLAEDPEHHGSIDTPGKKT